jgi:DNA (cytosine-5)-methyltransferase 3A
MNVLSLFDGMSCGQQALERAGIQVTNYYASEIDKYAIKVTMANYPKTIQLGSVVDVDGYTLPKIDLLIGGSPCQSFSFAGKRKGMSTKDEQEILTLDHYLQLKSEGYEFEGQSYLFWEYMRLLNEVKPKYFMLENVEMGEKWEKVLSKAIGVNGIHINSSLVSAQNRKRIYWTNIGMKPAGLFGDLESIIEQPKDKGILLKDILESEVDEKYFLSDKLIAGFERHKERHEDKGTGFGYKPKKDGDKGNSLRANAALAPTDNMIIVHNTQRRDPNRPSIQKNKNAGGSGQDVVSINMIQLPHGTNKGGIVAKDGKTPSMTISSWQCNNMPIINNRIRRLTPIECERLQTVAENYTNHVSDSQRYKMLGNGWTVDVIAHIFKYIKL